MSALRLVFRWLRPAALLLFPPLYLCTQSVGAQTLAAADLTDDKVVELSEFAWRYHAGDDARWAAAEFDDRAWEQVSGTTLKHDALPLSGWSGAAWFRLRLNVADDLAGRPLALRVWHWGASEIYLDGELIQSFGKIESAADEEFNPRGLFVPIVFARGGAHSLAVRYSFKAAADLSGWRGRWLVARGNFRPGFRLALASGEDATLRLDARARADRPEYVTIGLLSALALVHFLLFVFYPRERGNLFYSFFAVGLAATVWCARLMNAGRLSATSTLLAEIAQEDVQSLAVLSLLAFLYYEFAGRMSRFFWVLLLVWLVGFILHATRLATPYQFTPVMLVLALADGLRITIGALRRRRAGAGIIAAGVGIFILGVAVNIAVGHGGLNIPSWSREINLNLTLASIPVAVSVYLARSFARTNRDLGARLAEVEELSAQRIEQERREAALRVEHERTRAESERRAKELEEARQLQLSMLPASVPRLPDVSVAAYMRPASEVGGDYYDFHVAGDGTLSVVIGDATGHGLKAGTMVTATKSLFNSLAHEPDVVHIFRHMSAALKRMNLRGLFMAMTMMKLKGGRLVVASAGMPYALIRRAEGGPVEEVVIKAAPLGSMTNFPYRQQELSLGPGDMVLVMSDGFPEMFDESGEQMLGYDRAATILAQSARATPQEVIDRLVEVGERWAGARAPDDDVTFVVLKMT